MHITRSLRFILFALWLLAVLTAVLPGLSLAQIGISVSFGPPALPVYAQPVCPGDGYLWTPGYWAWDADDSDYYWVPGTWVEPPQVGFLWTPGWWGWGGSGFTFHEGFWGPTVGFYGGINYGFGYFGNGFQGGRWDHDHFFYNRSVTNVNVTNIHNVYNTTVINNTTVNRVSYNGGQGGITVRPTPEQEAAANGRHLAPVAAQMQQAQAARGNRELHASVNHGKPPIAATVRAGAFGDHPVAASEAGGEYHPPANREAAHPPAGEPAANREAVPRPPASEPSAHPENNAQNAVHPKDLPAMEHPAAPNTGNPKTDQQYQKQQQTLQAQQEKERQNLQKQQDKEHQQMAKQNADVAKQQQMEQRHQQQTQQLQQRHTQQQQQLQQRQQPSHSAPPQESHPAPPERK